MLRWLRSGQAARLPVHCCHWLRFVRGEAQTAACQSGGARQPGGRCIDGDHGHRHGDRGHRHASNQSDVADRSSGQRRLGAIRLLGHLGAGNAARHRTQRAGSSGSHESSLVRAVLGHCRAGYDRGGAKYADHWGSLDQNSIHRHLLARGRCGFKLAGQRGHCYLGSAQIGTERARRHQGTDRASNNRCDGGGACLRRCGCDDGLSSQTKFAANTMPDIAN